MSFTNDFDLKDITVDESTTVYPGDSIPVSMKIAACVAIANPVLALPAVGWWAAKQLSK